MSRTPYVSRADLSLTPPRPAATGATYGVPKITIPSVKIPPLLPKAPAAWKPRRRP